MKYRADIDGMRAIAVGGVVLYHLGLPGIPGGFTGVDIFFVISGFLVGTIVNDEIQRGKFSLIGFYERRVRRLLPALSVVLVVTLALGFWLLLPGDFRDLGRSMLAAVAFGSNLYFWATTSYFDGPAELKPLLHTWSLAVEEQFYIIFPLLLMMCAAWARGRTAALIVTLAALSFAYSVYAAFGSPAAAFYSPLSRAWQLAAGCLITLYELPPLGRRASEAAGLSGLASIAAGFLFLTETAPFPGLAALPPVVGSVLIILGGRQGLPTLAVRLLSNPVMVFVGLCSYSLYLWHWPLLAFARHYALRPLTAVELAAVGVVSMALSAASLSWVERPFRSKVLGRGIFILGGLVMGAIAAAALAVHFFKGFPGRFPSVEKPPGREIYAKCLIGPPKTFAAWSESACVYQDAANDAPLVVVWGDSYAAHYVPGLLEQGSPRGYALAQLTAEGCSPFLDYEEPQRPECRPFTAAAFAWIKANRPRAVVLSVRWNRYSDMDAAAQLLTASIHRLQALGAQVVLIGESPVFAAPVPQIAAVFASRGSRGNRAMPQNAFKSAQHLRDVAAKTGAALFEPQRQLCDASGCAFRNGANLYFEDAGHLSLMGSKRLTSDLHPIIAAALAK